MGNDPKNTKTNVVGIGHNNTYSKEQYEKLLSSFHRVLDYAGSAIYNVERLFDDAFTGYYNSSGYSSDKLKPFQKYERRQRAKAQVTKAATYFREHSEEAEAKAKANGLKLEVVEERKRLQKLDDEANKKESDD